MKKLKLIFSAILLVAIAAGCSKEGIDGDTSFVTTPSSSDPSATLNISNDNSGDVTVTPLGNGASYFLVDFGHDNAVSDTLHAGYNAVHSYPEGNYTVTVTPFDLLKRAGAPTTLPLTLTYRAPEDVDFAIANDVKISATAKYTNSFLVYYGDVPNETGTPLATGATLPSHVYADGGPYNISVKAISGNPTYAGAATTMSAPKQVWGFPIDFENPAVNYFFGTFGNVGWTQVANPAPGGINTSANVGKYEKPSNAETWSGTYTPLSIPMNIATGHKVKVLVYNPDPANIGKMLNVELEAGDPDTGAPGNGTGILKVPLTTSGAWEELVFDFSTISGIPATSRFGQLVLRFNDIAMGSGETIYLDNFRLTN